METVPATASARIIQRDAQIIPAKEPLERTARLRNPVWVVGGMIGLDAGGNCGLRLNGLLVKVGALFSASGAEESMVWALATKGISIPHHFPQFHRIPRSA